MSRALLVLNTAADRQKACVHCGAFFSKKKEYSQKYWREQKYCSWLCSGKARSEDAVAKTLPKAAAFAVWVDSSRDCWEWTGARDKDGYGIFSYDRKTHRANRVALELDGRPVPMGLYACHTCDNPACVRPSHLYPGTPTQNMSDAMNRGRVAKGERRSSLTTDGILAIRLSHDSAPTLAERYGVSRSTISMIRTRKTWRHVP